MLPPVTQADKRDIFRAYESALLRPAERCWDWELTDPLVRRVVSDAAEHLGAIARMTDCYRSPAYNKGLYTKKREGKEARQGARVVTRVRKLAYTSLLMKRMAIDFTVEGSPAIFGLFRVSASPDADAGRRRPLCQERHLHRFGTAPFLDPALRTTSPTMGLGRCLFPPIRHLLEGEQREGHQRQRQGEREQDQECSDPLRPNGVVEQSRWHEILADVERSEYGRRTPPVSSVRRPYLTVTLRLPPPPG